LDRLAEIRLFLASLAILLPWFNPPRPREP